MTISISELTNIKLPVPKTSGIYEHVLDVISEELRYRTHRESSEPAWAAIRSALNLGIEQMLREEIPRRA